MYRKSNNIIIIGGNAAGAAAAAQAKKQFPDKNIFLIEKSDYFSTGTCEIPLVISGELSKNDIVFFNPDTFYEKKGVKVLIKSEAKYIDTKSKVVKVLNLQNGNEAYIDYDKLIIATGSKPNIPTEFSKKYSNLFFVKDVTNLDNLIEYLKNNIVKSVGIFGSGYIALEMAEAFKKLGKDVNIYHNVHYPELFDDKDVNDFIEKLLLENEINFIRYKNLTILERDNKIDKIKLDNNIFSNELYILATGFQPNSEIAVNSGLRLEQNSIFTDRYLKTSDKDISAAGDCTHYYDFFTKKPIYLPFATFARFSAYAAVKNLYERNEPFPFVVKNSVVKIFDYFFLAIGLNNRDQKQRGIFTRQIFEWHENKIHLIKDRKKNFVKLFVDNNNKIVGGYLIGGEEVTEMGNNIMTYIKLKLSYKNLEILNYNYSPQCSNMINILYKISKK